VTVEGQCHCSKQVLFGEVNDSTKQRLMTKVNAIEFSNGYRGVGKILWNLRNS
jgi:hypothetical protein